MKIIIDAMGGDHAPDEIIKGCCAAGNRFAGKIILVGREKAIAECARQNQLELKNMEIIHADDIIRMEDDPVQAIYRKKNASMVIGLNMLAKGRGDAFVSAGNTGALFSGATLIVGRAEGIKRAAIGTILPGKKPCLLLDAGANVSVTPEYMEQFAEIGTAYMKKMYGIAKPEVGILNNGTEDCKGTSLQIEAGKRLRENASIHFIGNVEASGIMAGACDVVVCDGFSGNIFLKATEGMGRQTLLALKEVYSKSWMSKLSYMMIRKDIGKLKKQFDASEYGGSPILGIEKPVIKAHGSSDARAFENAILQAVQFTKAGQLT